MKNNLKFTIKIQIKLYKRNQSIKINISKKKVKLKRYKIRKKLKEKNNKLEINKSIKFS